MMKTLLSSTPDLQGALGCGWEASRYDKRTIHDHTEGCHRQAAHATSIHMEVDVML